MENITKLAVLIDADNAQPTIIDSLLAEIANYGIASVKRIYGDWTSPGLKGWKEILLQHSIQPMQQFAYTKSLTLNRCTFRVRSTYLLCVIVMNKELIVGISVVIAVVAIVAYVSGIYGLIYVGLTLVVGLFALFLFTRNSKVAKVGAVIVFPEILTKLLMPKKSKLAIKDLEEKENDT